MPTLPGRLIRALLVLPFLWSVSSAQNAGSAALDDVVPGASVTYLDLVRLIIPDLAASGNGYYRGGGPIDVRAIGGEDSGGEPPESAGLSDVEALPVQSAGRDRLLLLIDLGSSSDSAEGYAVLALYDLTGAPKLLDAANVAVDRFTSFREPARVAIADGDDAFLTSSLHFNSSQGYMISPLMMIRDDRLQLIDMIYTFDENLCDYKRTQNLAFKTTPGSRPYAAIKATVTETTAPNGDSCGEAPPASEREISVTYHWDAAKSEYMPIPTRSRNCQQRTPNASEPTAFVCPANARE